MFGAVVAYFFEYLLGIKQTSHKGGYSSVIIDPQAVSCFGWMSGSMATPNGKIEVGYKKTDNGIKFEIIIPHKTEAVFKYKDGERILSEGRNIFTVCN